MNYKNGFRAVVLFLLCISLGVGIKIIGVFRPDILLCLIGGLLLLGVFLDGAWND